MFIIRYLGVYGVFLVGLELEGANNLWCQRGDEKLLNSLSSYFLFSESESFRQSRNRQLNCKIFFDKSLFFNCSFEISEFIFKFASFLFGCLVVCVVFSLSSFGSEFLRFFFPCGRVLNGKGEQNVEMFCSHMFCSLYLEGNKLTEFPIISEMQNLQRWVEIFMWESFFLICFSSDLTSHRIRLGKFLRAVGKIFRNSKCENDFIFHDSLLWFEIVVFLWVHSFFFVVLIWGEIR